VREIHPIANCKLSEGVSAERGTRSGERSEEAGADGTTACGVLRCPGQVGGNPRDREMLTLVTLLFLVSRVVGGRRQWAGSWGKESGGRRADEAADTFKLAPLGQKSLEITIENEKTAQGKEREETADDPRIVRIGIMKTDPATEIFNHETHEKKEGADGCVRRR